MSDDNSVRLGLLGAGLVAAAWLMPYGLVQFVTLTIAIAVCVHAILATLFRK